MIIKTESLAYWYFRLNGFLTSINFVIHTERRGITGTDVDILGVRFPYRAELFNRPMVDDNEFRRISSKPYVVIAEVKKGRCALNGPWTIRERRNIDRVLRAIGIIPIEHIEAVAESLYSNGYYKSKEAYISLICIGKEPDSDITTRYPQVPQITWIDITKFIYKRFQSYKNVKTWHPSWDADGKGLWKCFKESEDEASFIRSIEIVSG